MARPNPRALPPGFEARYKANLEAAKAKQPTPAPAPKSPPTLAPESESFSPVEPPVFWVASIKLSPGKGRYYVALGNETRKMFMLIIRECGKPLQVTRHLYAIHPIPEDAKTLKEILAAPIISNGMTNSFLFHDKNAASKAVIEIIR